MIRSSNSSRWSSWHLYNAGKNVFFETFCLVKVFWYSNNHAAFLIRCTLSEHERIPINLASENKKENKEENKKYGKRLDD